MKNKTTGRLSVSEESYVELLARRIRFSESHSDLDVTSILSYLYKACNLPYMATLSHQDIIYFESIKNDRSKTNEKYRTYREECYDNGIDLNLDIYEKKETKAPDGLQFFQLYINTMRAYGSVYSLEADGSLKTFLKLFFTYRRVKDNEIQKENFGYDLLKIEFIRNIISTKLQSMGKGKLPPKAKLNVLNKELLSKYLESVGLTRDEIQWCLKVGQQFYVALVAENSEDEEYDATGATVMHNWYEEQDSDNSLDIKAVKETIENNIDTWLCLGVIKTKKTAQNIKTYAKYYLTAYCALRRQPLRSKTAVVRS